MSNLPGIETETMRLRMDRRSLLRRTAHLGVGLSLVGLLAACGEDDEAVPTATTAPATDDPETDATSESGDEPDDSDDGEPTGDKPVGGRLIVGRSLDADGYDPHQSSQIASSQVFYWVIDTLVTLDEDLNVVPGNLAESWEVSEDALEYTWTVREGITFHDGTPFNAEAVKFSFERSLGPIENPNSGDLGDIIEFEVLDEYTIKYKMSEPFASHLVHLTSPYHGILSPTAIQEDGDQAFMQHPVGTGPFKFKEWIVDERVTLERFDDYKDFRPYRENNGPAYIDELVFQRIPEEQTQLVALETGDIQIAPIPGQQMSRFEGNDDFQLINIVERNIIYLNIVSRLEGDEVIYPEPVDDVRVRQALICGLNVQEIIDGVLGGLAEVNPIPMVAGNFAHDPEALSDAIYEFDPDRAAELLDEAGWEMGSSGVRERDGQPLRLNLMVTSTTTNDRIAQALQGAYQTLGIQVDIESLESATYLERRDASEFDLALSTLGWFEPFIMQWLYNLETPGVGYYGKFNPEADALLGKANGTVDQEERKAFYVEAMRLILADAPMIPLWTTISVTGARSEVGGLSVIPGGSVDYYGAYFKEQ